MLGNIRPRENSCLAPSILSLVNYSELTSEAVHIPRNLNSSTDSTLTSTASLFPQTPFEYYLNIIEAPYLVNSVNSAQSHVDY